MFKRGRKTKLTPALQDKFMRARRAGNFIETCCDYVGINPDTYYEWMKRGEQAGENNRIYREFADAARQASASAEIESVARIRVSGQNGNWKADAWFLERSAPSRWGRTRVEVTGKDGEPLHPPGPAINVRDLDDEALAVLERSLARLTPDDS